MEEYNCSVTEFGYTNKKRLVFYKSPLPLYQTDFFEDMIDEFLEPEPREPREVPFILDNIEKFNHFSQEEYEIFITSDNFADFLNPPKRVGDFNKESFEHSLQRTRRIIRDLILSNRREDCYFFTLTNKYSSKEYEDIDIDSANEDFKKHILKKLQNNVARYDIGYIAVTELTKRGYVHFHGIMWNIPVQFLKDSGQKTNKGEVIYNLINFDKDGFNTATKIDDFDRCTTYICKYMSKDVHLKDKGFHRFYHSRNIDRPFKYKRYLAEPKQEPVFENDYIKIFYIN